MGILNFPDFMLLKYISTNYYCFYYQYKIISKLGSGEIEAKSLLW
jgi:hypothetical protein